LQRSTPGSRAAGITTGPIFRHVDKSGQVQLGRLSAWGFVKMLKERLAAAGFDPEEFSGHSLRAGFVTSALKSGADVFKAADQGRWKRLETVRGYDRRAKLFDKHAGGDFL
jgi:integrase